MANKQTLVAQAKQVFDNLASNKLTIARLEKEMLADVLSMKEKFDFFTPTVFGVVLSGTASLETLHQLKNRIIDLLRSCAPYHTKLLNAKIIQKEGVEAMKRFASIYKDGNWTKISRCDVLELRRLFKKDSRISKLKDINLDELAREWDETSIINQLEHCCLEVRNI
ncbi:unnamed protein product [Orchesella dallaii]|uniref:Uncharacterized protein n=1 Tax=Orchesella dallaii TaxID=48710 RepID=A0ABP1S485_9HEXA